MSRFQCLGFSYKVTTRNVIESELMPEATTEKISVVQIEGERKVNGTPVFYNFDMIISVGYTHGKMLMMEKLSNPMFLLQKTT